MKKIAVTGASGYIASLIQTYNKDKFEFIPISRAELDFEQPEKVTSFFEALEFDCVLHTAANATTADCENNPEMTHKINTQSTIAIADVCKRKKKRLIFFSTEQCFNGHTKKGPFKETDELISVTNYGKQKAEADDYISNHLNDFITLRLSWMMGLPQPNIRTSSNIIKNTLAAILDKKEAMFTVNEVRCMTYAQNLANQFETIVNMESGVYNFANENGLNTYEAAKFVAKNFGFDDELIDRYIKPNLERYADRPRDYRLDNTKIKQQGVELTTFEEDIISCFKDYGWK